MSQEKSPGLFGYSLIVALSPKRNSYDPKKGGRRDRIFSKCKSMRMRLCKGEKWAWNIFLSLFTFCGDSSPYGVSSAHLSSKKTTKPATRETLLQFVLGLRSKHVVGSVRLLAKKMDLLLKIKWNSIKEIHLKSDFV